ncbi:hypothetical protein HT576_08735 [Haloterrigena sp. SYSU A121-1]|uniref:Uncharacterized protein n=1 Tax=Haloterrigena gelatinilytica TaxID=2741724 RepID=A0A8J8KBA4_9EURY|nr:hypothetical protein [Haloterrigena gelatinilytica]NUB91105.1 hypothetical protein [Haloterrigena gelatinilytica]
MELRETAETMVGWKLSLASALAMLVSGLVLLSTGLRHIFSPAEALLADLLDMVNLAVAASPELSLAGLLWLLSILVGISVAMTGIYLLWAFGQMIWNLME